MLNRQFWAGRRVLLTGHTGFKGSWLALWLSQLGAQVHGVALAPDTRPALFEQLELTSNLAGHHLLDIGDAAGLAAIAAACQPQVVLHLAAQPLVRRSYQDPLGTWATNVQGSLHLLEALKLLEHPCAVVMVTTDKVYANQEWDYGYREDDRLGGHDPYSASKAAAEIAIASWRDSFCGTAPHQTPHLRIATARAGNVIGGGDWAEDRLIPDFLRAIDAGRTLEIRSPHATRPWQHVLEPVSGYMMLAQRLCEGGEAFDGAWNFGPSLDDAKPVQWIVQKLCESVPGASWCIGDSPQPHEAHMLSLDSTRARNLLGWRPRWALPEALQRTLAWHLAWKAGHDLHALCVEQIRAHQAAA